MIDTTFLGILLQHKEFLILYFITIFWYQLTSLLLLRFLGSQKTIVLLLLDGTMKQMQMPGNDVMSDNEGKG